MDTKDFKVNWLHDIECEKTLTQPPLCSVTQRWTCRGGSDQDGKDENYAEGEGGRAGEGEEADEGEDAGEEEDAGEGAGEDAQVAVFDPEVKFKTDMEGQRALRTSSTSSSFT